MAERAMGISDAFSVEQGEPSRPNLPELAQLAVIREAVGSTESLLIMPINAEFLVGGRQGLKSDWPAHYQILGDKQMLASHGLCPIAAF